MSFSQVQVRKIANDAIVYTNNYDKNSINELYNYLSINLKVPVDIVFLEDLNFRNITSCDMSNPELKNILRKSDCNTAFFVKRKKSIEVCDVNISDFAGSTVKKLSEIGLRINSISCWPFWIINNYFSTFPEDTGKFKCSMFVITTNEYVDITAVIGEVSILCNRHFEKSHFSEEEVKNTVQYVSEKTNLKLDDIAVYCINEETIATLTKKLSSTMYFVSSVLPENIAPILDENRKIVKTILRIVSGCLAVYLVFQISELILLNGKILNFEEIKNSVPEVVVSEMKLWENIKGVDIKQIDYSDLISNILRNTENANISDADISTKNNQLFIKIKLLDSLIDREYTKDFVANNYKFKVSVSDKGIICSGTPC
jgi:hypothetical protein